MSVICGLKIFKLESYALNPKRTKLLTIVWSIVDEVKGPVSIPSLLKKTPIQVV